MIKTARLASVLTLAVLFLAGMAFAQTDPGVRSTTGVNAGQPFASVSASANDLAFFQTGLAQFNEHQTVTGDNNGLGPRFNLDSCGACHSQPAPGGTGPAANVFPNIGANPQSQVIANGVVSGSTNTIPSFVLANGPVREARFPFFFNSNGQPNFNNPNGGVEDLFTVSGRSDAGSCSLPQPSFAQAQNTNNIIFRIPTPVFGAGLMENVDDSTLQNNRAKNLHNNFGIGGDFNHNGNDGTISRFGWKAQNKSLMIFAGEAYNVEMGISNELFAQDRPLPGEDGNGGTGGRGLPANCLNLEKVGYPEDTTHTDGTSASTVASDAALFVGFMQFLAPPGTSNTINGVNQSASIARGRADFIAIGCATCHNASPGSTQVSSSTPTTSGTGSLSLNAVNSFSDIEIHHMGTFLADNVGQGGAGGDQFRSAPLWGLGQRIFLLHDGRTTNLITAINDHFSNGSEANQAAINFFNGLSGSQQQDVLNFLRSL